MKRSFAVLVSGFLIIISSCSNSGTNEQHKESGNQTNKPHLTKAEDILIDFKTWYNYTNYNIHLSRDFIGLDIDSGKINKTRFLDRLTTGKFVPLKIKDENNLPTYKLYALNNNDPDITSTISQMALNEILHFRMEGKELPDYDFIDLNGKTYDRITTRGKVLVIKCWFIRCVACVKEFSELNKLVDNIKTETIYYS